MKKKILLTISFLASRHSDDVKRCIDSLESIRKALPCEVIAVDTSGGDEALREMLYEYVDEVVPFTWCDDFAKARNAGLERAKGEWFLYIDDDEWFVETETIIYFFESGIYKKYDGANYIVRNFTNREGTMWTDAWVSRMVKLQPGRRFISPVHEYFFPVPDSIVALNAMVYHFGYAYATKADARKHFERNSRLLKKMLEQEPDNVRWREQMLMEYATISDWQALYEFSEECLERFRDCRGEDEDGAWGAFLAARIIAKDGVKDYERAYELCENGLKDKRISQLAQAFMCLRKGRYGMHLGKYAQTEVSVLEYLNWKKYFEKHERMLVRQSNVPFVRSVFEPLQLHHAYSVLVCAGLKQKKINYLKKYWAELDYGKEHVHVYPYMPECLIEAMATMPSDPVFISVLQTVFGNDSLWKTFQLGLLKWVMEGREGSLHLIKLLKEADIDDSFLKVYYLRNQVCVFPEERSDEELQKLLETYASCAVEYFKDSYADQLELGCMEELPPDYRAVLLLQELLGERQLEKKLAIIKQVVEAYPPMADTMKRYLRLLEQAPESQPDAQAALKLQQMAEQVLKQVDVLVEMGQLAEARSVVQQLRVMLPEDKRIREMDEQLGR